MADNTFDARIVALNDVASYGSSALPTVISAVKTLTAADHGGRRLRLNCGTAFAITLPTIVATAQGAGSGPGADPNSLTNLGLTFEFFITTAVSGTQTIVCGGSDKMIGIATMASGSVPLAACFVGAASSNYVKLSMNGGTTGGLEGSWIRVTAIASAQWFVTAFLNGSSTTATPFST
jgi:hypothetical protein